jgi:alpha-L-glutamate ligase-like protein
MRLLLPWRILKSKGILGINQRNADYILPLNKRRYYPLVDDKLATKKLAIKYGIAVPNLYGVIEIYKQLENFEKILEKHNDFVIKPRRGSQGHGILVIAGRRKDKFIKPDDTLMSLHDINYHVINILSGVYSLGGVPDSAMVEYRVKPSRFFNDISFKGVPDMRIIVYKGIPVMAMLRLPTSMSDGKANLHQGAVGVGVNIINGVTTSAVIGNEIVDEHPDSGNKLINLQIPLWDESLQIASRCFDFTNLIYVGVDIVIDDDLGPLVLELNARPGLNIQLANQDGLSPRLKAIDNITQIPEDISARIKLAKELFS